MPIVDYSAGKANVWYVEEAVGGGERGGRGGVVKSVDHVVLTETKQNKISGKEVRTTRYLQRKSVWRDKIAQTQREGKTEKKKGNLSRAGGEVEAGLTAGHSSSLLGETNCWQRETGPINHLLSHLHTHTHARAGACTHLHTFVFS